MSRPTVAAQARTGIFSLLARQLITFPITFLAGIALARMLGPTDFGTYATVSFLVMGAGVLVDVGLGALLIQQPEEPTPTQLKSVFTAQLLVFGIVTAVLMVVAPWLAQGFRLPEGGEWLLRAMALNMLVGTLGTNSTLLLERRMGFPVFARLDVLTVLLDRGTALALAFAGFGAWSFVIASLVSMTTRVALLYLAAPWTLGLALDWAVLKRALGFGAFFQGINLTALARDNMNTLLGGPLFGPRSVGHLNWGMGLAQTCSQPLVHILGRVAFPAFSRLQDDPAERDRMLGESLYWLNLATFPMLLLLMATGDGIVTYVYGEAWRPGLWALYAFAFRLMAANVTSVMVTYLNASGRTKLSFQVTAAWTVVEWAIAAALVAWLGFNGIAAAYALGVLLPVFWLLAIVGREVPLAYGRLFALPLALGLSGAGVAWALQGLVHSLWSFLAVLAVSGALPLAGILALEGRRLRAFVQERLAGRRTPPVPEPVEP